MLHDVRNVKKLCIALIAVLVFGLATTAFAKNMFSFEYISYENGGTTGYIPKNDNEQIMYVTVEEHDLISGDEVKFKGRDESNDVMTNTITFTSNSGLSRTTSYSTYCGAGTRIRLHGVCSKYSNSQGTDRIFTTEGRWTP